MKIAFLTPEYPHPLTGNSGGIGTSIKNLALGLLQQGCVVRVLVYGQKEDLALQTNTILYSEFVVNLGSSMIFDYALHGKKCAYINYDVSNKLLESWSTDTIYKYIHFRSMPNPNAVIWFNNPEEIKEKIINILLDSEVNHSALEWSRTILGNRPEKASLQIWNAIDKILKYDIAFM